MQWSVYHRHILPWVALCYAAVATGVYGLKNACWAVFLFQGVMVLGLLHRGQLKFNATQVEPWCKTKFNATQVEPWCKTKFNTTQGWLLTAACGLCGPALGLLWHKPQGLLEGLGVHHPILFLLWFSLVNPILEELFWRGHPWSALRCARKWRLKNGHPWSALSFRPYGRLGTGHPHPDPLLDGLFAGYHVLVVAQFVPIGIAALIFVNLSIISAMWRLLARCTGSLKWCMISHAVADASIMGYLVLF